ncbi:unnamed protein product [Cutaneotrichosporon oleaginosum]
MWLAGWDDPNHANQGEAAARAPFEAFACDIPTRQLLCCSCALQPALSPRLLGTSDHRDRSEANSVDDEA